LERGYQLTVTSVQGVETAMNFDNQAVETADRHPAIMAIAEVNFIKCRLATMLELRNQEEAEKAQKEEPIDFAKAKAATKTAPKKKVDRFAAAAKAAATRKKNAAAKKKAEAEAAKQSEVKEETPAPTDDGTKPAIVTKTVKTDDNVLS